MVTEDILSRKIVIEKAAEGEMERTGGEEGITEGKREDVVSSITVFSTTPNDIAFYLIVKLIIMVQ